MIYLKRFETFTNDITIGVDIDGTINNFSDAYSELYKRYFPDKEPAINDNWYWYRQMDYNGEDPDKWFKEKKAETFKIAKPYPNAVININNIYDLVKSHGFKLKIVTNQSTEEAKQEAKIWLDKYGFKYDDIIFVNAAKDKWKYADIMIDDADKVLNNKPLSKISIKIDQPWNTASDGDINIPNIGSLTIDIIKLAISKLKNKTTV